MNQLRGLNQRPKYTELMFACNSVRLTYRDYGKLNKKRETRIKSLKGRRETKPLVTTSV